MAGGVPEVMLHLRRLGLLELGCLTASGDTLGRTLDWWEGSERRRALRERLRAPGRRRSRRRDHVAGAGAGPGAHQHDHVSARQPRARGLRDQEHGDRSLRRRRRRRLPEDGARARLHDGARGHRRDQEHGARAREGRRRPGADLPRPDGHGHGGDLPDHRRPQAPVVRQARRRADGRALLGRVHGRLRRARRARGAGRRPHRQARRGRPGPDRDRPEPARGLDRPGRPRRPRVVPRRGRPRARRSVALGPTSRPTPISRRRLASGRRSRRSAAAPGAGACTTWTRSRRCSGAGRAWLVERAAAGRRPPPHRAHRPLGQQLAGA